MIYGLYQSAAGLLTTDYRQAVIANNLANAETVGFKRDIAVLAERVPAADAGIRSGPSDPNLAGLTGGLWLGRTHTDCSPGPAVSTDNALDLALQGPGFFVVRVNGQPLYTRDGRLMVREDGRIVAAADGAEVVSVGGAPLRARPTGGPLAVDEDGVIRQDGRRIGQLALADFSDYSVLRKVGATRFAAPEAAAGPSSARVQAGFVESSGVEPIAELVEMMAASRAYQMNAQMIALQDQTIGKLIGGALRA